jgi:O-acetylhomoserine (thiol)-lyase
MERHVENALQVARYFEQHPMVERVRYAGLESSPYYDLARKYLPRGAGAIFAIDIRGGREAGRAFIETLDLWSHLANVGDTKSLVIHPASTTHRQLTDEELVANGITAGTIRISVGLESVDDLIWDLGRGLAAARAAAAVPAGAEGDA